MFFADYHMHTSFSSDSDAPMESMILAAISLGLKQIALTDHVDFDYPDVAFPFLIDYDEYLETFSYYQNKYKDQIELLLGVEIGFQPHLKHEIADLVNKYPFDFIIGSTHVVDRADLYNGDFFKGKTQKNAYLRYFEDVLHSIRTFDEFNVYGHLDYIIRYGDYTNKVLSYKDYQNIIDEILKALIHKGKGLEVNTSGHRYGLGQFHPQKAILETYHGLGGEIITIGSDAHRPQDICACFHEAYKMLKDVGFKYVTIFKDQKPEFISIESYTKN